MQHGHVRALTALTRFAVLWIVCGFGSHLLLWTFIKSNLRFLTFGDFSCQRLQAQNCLSALSALFVPQLNSCFLLAARELKVAPAMPGLSCSVTPTGFWPMELEAQQHYFYYDGLETGEDFYKSTAPSEDIWKKFELLPTPPVSPSRSGSECPGWMSPKPTFEEDYGSPYELELEPLDVLANLSSIVLKDCMWSGLAAGQQLEKVTRDAKVAPTARAQRVAPATTHTYSSPATQCVSPAAVLSLPGHHGKKTVSGSSISDSLSDSSGESLILKMIVLKACII